MGKKVVLQLELIKPSTLCGNVNGECLISINKESSTSGHIEKWNTNKCEHFTSWNVHIAFKFFIIMIPNGYMAATHPNIMTKNNNKEKRHINPYAM
jgi:hypothetical protein